MRHSGLSLAVIFLLSSFTLAQHSSGGGGGSAGSSSTGGGGSHGGGSYSGGSSSGGGSHSGSSGSGHSSGGGHVSGGSASHGSSGHSSHVGRTTSTSNATRVTRSNLVHSNANLRSGSQSVHPERRSFFSFLRHPFRRPEPQKVSDLRHRVCLRGPCQVCPNGQITSSGACGGPAMLRRRHNYCSRAQLWSGDACILGVWLLDDCESYRAAMQLQAERVHNAEMLQQNACPAGPTPSCIDANNALQSEQSLYQQFAARYQQCRMRFQTAYPPSAFGLAFGYAAYGPNHWFESLSFDLGYQR